MKRRAFLGFGLAAAIAPLVPNVAASEAAQAVELGPEDFLEGSWTPTITDSFGKVYATGVGRYTKVGGLVTVTLTATLPVKPGRTTISNLPVYPT